MMCRAAFSQAMPSPISMHPSTIASHLKTLDEGRLIT